MQQSRTVTCGGKQSIDAVELHLFGYVILERIGVAAIADELGLVDAFEKCSLGRLPLEVEAKGRELTVLETPDAARFYLRRNCYDFSCRVRIAERCGTPWSLIALVGADVLHVRSEF